MKDMEDMKVSVEEKSTGASTKASTKASIDLMEAFAEVMGASMEVEVTCMEA